MQKNVIVVGAPRSGTSVTAGVFARQGYYVGRTPNDAMQYGNYDNPFGYFEAADVIAANVRLFKRAGYEFHNTWLFDPITERRIRKLRRLRPSDEDTRLIRAYSSKAPWLWKDPRLCFTLEYWARLVDWRNTIVVFVKRDLNDVYWSFRRRGWCEGGADARRALSRQLARHVEAAEEAIKTCRIPHLEAKYTDFGTQPRRMAHRLSAVSGLKLDASDLNFRPELDHSGLLGRISGYARLVAHRLPASLVQRARRVAPTRLLRLLFPETRYIERRRKDM